MTWPVRAATMYMEPFRFAHQAPGWIEPSMGEIAHSDASPSPMARSPASCPAASRAGWPCPGRPTRRVAARGTTKTYDPYVPTFWPARVPNQVLTKENYEIVMDQDQAARRAPRRLRQPRLVARPARVEELHRPDQQHDQRLRPARRGGGDARAQADTEHSRPSSRSRTSTSRSRPAPPLARSEEGPAPRQRGGLGAREAARRTTLISATSTRCIGSPGSGVEGSMLEADVVIIGAGPAGATACAQSGTAPSRAWSWSGGSSPADRIGESLAPAARRLLTDMGLWDDFLADGHSPWFAVRSVWGTQTPTERDSLADLDGHGWHLDRRRFEARLRGAPPSPAGPACWHPPG